MNGDPTIGRQGSIPPAEAIEHPQREIVNVINFSGIAPSAGDLRQMTRAVRSQRLNYARDTGSVNNFSVAYDPPITAYTVGLVLRVLIGHPNTGACTINAGAGSVPVRKMNGADLADGDLVAGSVATLVFDGTNFQLSNFVGVAPVGPPQVFSVKIPYTVDHSPIANEVRADFLPVLPPLSAGDMIAVKIANTNTRPTQIWVDSQAPVPLSPNGGGIMLQGDIAEGDIVIFFFDGTRFFFAPNPEINANVTYTVAPPGLSTGHFQDTAGQPGTAFNNAMNALKRKVIGANAQVILQLLEGNYPGPLQTSHPSAERLVIRGTMKSGMTPPTMWNFLWGGNSVVQQNQDGVQNELMLRSRYGTVITVQNPAGVGIENVGPGRVTFNDLLIIGHDLPAALRSQTGAQVDSGYAMRCNNISVWGVHNGFFSSGAMWCRDCFSSKNKYMGFGSANGGNMWLTNCHVFGGASWGLGTDGGALHCVFVSVRANRGFGVYAMGGGGLTIYWSDSVGNDVDLLASSGASVSFIYWPGYGAWLTTSPIANVVGNQGAIIAFADLNPAGPPSRLPRPW